MGTDSRLGGRPRTRLNDQVRRRRQPCAMCGLPIDQTLPRRGRRHKLASVIDEWIPRNPCRQPDCRHNCQPDTPPGQVSAANCVEMHDLCNSAKSNHWPVTNAMRIDCRRRVLDLLGCTEPEIDRTW